MNRLKFYGRLLPPIIIVLCALTASIYQESRLVFQAKLSNGSLRSLFVKAEQSTNFDTTNAQLLLVAESGTNTDTDTDTDTDTATTPLLAKSRQDTTFDTTTVPVHFGGDGNDGFLLTVIGLVFVAVGALGSFKNQRIQRLREESERHEKRELK